MFNKQQVVYLFYFFSLGLNIIKNFVNESLKDRSQKLQTYFTSTCPKLLRNQ